MHMSFISPNALPSVNQLPSRSRPEPVKSLRYLGRLLLALNAPAVIGIVVSFLIREARSLGFTAPPPGWGLER
jgi:hypothetical protein